MEKKIRAFKRVRKKDATKKNNGRPITITDEIIDKICSAVRLGSYIETAAAFAGVPKSTFYDWLKSGAAKQDPLCVKLSDTIEKALAESELRDINRIDKAAEKGAWQASAWRLERKFPKKWGRKEIVRHEDVTTNNDSFGEESVNKLVVDLIEKENKS